MAAGLGFKDFQTGEVLTAADVDGYLMQGVWVFASATARDAAVTSPQEGNFAYLKDTNVTTYYTGSAWANLDTTGMTNPMTTTGDTIYSSSGSTPARLGIGTAGQVLQVNSGATAPEWAAPASSSGPTFKAFRNTSAQAVAQNTYTKVQFNAESWDTDNCFDSTTNYRFTPNKAGYYSLISRLGIDQSTNNLVSIELYKNGAAIDVLQYGSPTNSTDYIKGNSAIAFANGTTDYFEVYVYLSANTTRNIDTGVAWTVFTGVWIRS
jgi:hypothetical protein